MSINLIFSKTGKIIEGDYKGSFVYLSQEKNGFSIYLSRTRKSEANREIYDYWFPNKEELNDHILESNWQILWLEDDFF